MPQLSGSKTYENLKRAFATEAQANRLYVYFARQADVEGYTDIAGLFRDSAEGENGHALGHLDFLKEVGDPVSGLPMGDTVENLQAAILTETDEASRMYVDFAQTAQAEGFDEIVEWFETLARAEKAHAGHFQRALNSLLQKS